MKLGAEFPQAWREKSTKDKIALSDILYGQAVEDIMYRITNSSFQEYLWLTNEEALGEEAYKKISKESLEFLYVEREKKSFQKNLSAGDSFEKGVLALFIDEIFHNSSNVLNNIEETDASWEYKIEETDTGVTLLLTYTYMEIKVPLTISIQKASLSKQKPKQKKMNTLFYNKKECIYLSYAKENVLSEEIFEIMSKLELISSMEAYDVANEVLKTQSISGRHIIENLKLMGEKEPKVITKKRLEQVTSYKNYGYMKKRWQQYVRVHKSDAEIWEEAMERILAFLTPIWTALCDDKIFLEDWMPELNRFLD